ncbi:MAG TPA: thioredoxin family protein [Sphingobacteriaceae bacterium]|nr:thioredoxin family protein [Sphingobacteriaceae bacterium]
MDFQAYLSQFEQILTATNPKEPYNDPDFFEYTKLNYSRTKRWLKTGRLNEETVAAVKGITKAQTWIIITEPWCGDAAHSVPFIEMIGKENPLITTTYELRDSEPFRIESYLTNGSKSIPKLVIKDENGEDLAVWGPRPEECQAFFQKFIDDKADLDTMKEALQIWYNQDKGNSIQREITNLIQS